MSIAGQVNIPEFIAVIGEIQRLLAKRNLRPVFQRPIDRQKGIKISGQFRTTHSGAQSPFSYITVGRQPDKAVVHDGFGLAWRTGVATSGNYNLYLVDNNILSENTPIRTNNMIWEENLNNFLAYGAYTIEPNVNYKFGIHIDSTLGTRVCVYSGGIGSGNPDYDQPYSSTNTSGYLMSMGARYEGYEPQANGTDFGISVLDTDGADWVYDNLRIVTSIEGHPASLYKLHTPVTSFSLADGAQLYLRGSAQDGLGNYGLNWYLWNYDSELWEYIGSNSGITLSGVVYNTGDLINYITDDFLYVMGMGSNAGMEGVINTDYVRISTPPPSGVHGGHMTDIYVHAPTQIIRETKTVTATAGAIDLSTGAGFIHPIYEIETVYDIDEGEELIRDSAGTYTYYINNLKPHYTYSTKEDYSIQIPFASDDVEITYTYFEAADLIQNFLDSDDNRIPTCDNLVKIAPPAAITINVLQYRGSIEVTDLKTKIANWVNSLVRESFEISDFINYLYGVGVTYVNLANLSIEVTKYNMSGGIIETATITSSYAISEPNTFYTDTLKLAGVSKL